MSDDEDEKPKRPLKAPTEIKINDGMDVIQKRAKDVDGFLAKSNASGALLAAIADPPLGSKNEQAKDVCLPRWYYFFYTNSRARLTHFCPFVQPNR